MQDNTTLNCANTNTNAMGITAKMIASTTLTTKAIKEESISKIQEKKSTFSNNEKIRSPSLSPSNLSAKSYTNL